MCRAVLEDDPFIRMKTVLLLYLSGFYKKPKGLKKPYNPILGELFRCCWKHPNGSTTFYSTEQVLIIIFTSYSHLFTLYSFFIHSLFTLYSLVIHSLFTRYSLVILSSCTLYSLFIQFLFNFYSIFIQSIPSSFTLHSLLFTFYSYVIRFHSSQFSLSFCLFLSFLF